MGARDEVAVEVRGLACRLAAIHPHVEAVRLVALLDPGFRGQHRRQRPCSRRQAEPVRARRLEMMSRWPATGKPSSITKKCSVRSSTALPEGQEHTHGCCMY